MTVTDESGNSSSASRNWRVDTIKPTVTATAPPSPSLAWTFGLSYTGADAGGSGIASYDVRWRGARYNATFGALQYPVAWQRSAGSRVSLPATPGGTYCLAVRSRDRAGNLSAWSPERCTAVPLDDRSLVASAGWTRSTGTGYYLGTATGTAAKGATLTRTGVQARRISLVATRCITCGSVGIYWNGTLVKTISLKATSTLNRQVLTVADFGSTRNGTLTIRTLTTGRVAIDGLGLSRI